MYERRVEGSHRRGGFGGISAAQHLKSELVDVTVALSSRIVCREGYGSDFLEMACRISRTARSAHFDDPPTVQIQAGQQRHGAQTLILGIPHVTGDRHHAQLATSLAPDAH